MNAIRYLLQLAIYAGIFNSGKVIFGLLRMHWRYFLFGRGRGLIKFLPLATPLKVHIDPASSCNFRCFFCPQVNPQSLKEAGFKFTSMSLEHYRGIIDGFKAFPDKVQELMVGNYGEPLLNPQVGEMIAYAKESGTVREVTLITNASLLKGERLEKLAKSGVDKVRISIEALSDEGYYETTKVHQSFEEIVSNLIAFKRSVRKYGKKTFIYVKIVDTGMTDEDRRKFFRTFVPIADAVAIENLVGITAKAREIIGSNPKGMTGVSLAKERRICPSPFYSLSIHSNGDVAVCCVDWHRKTTVGSVQQESIKSIWDGQALNAFRRNQVLKSWRGVDACKGCELVKHYPMYEDLDAHGNKLNALLEK